MGFMLAALLFLACFIPSPSQASYFGMAIHARSDSPTARRLQARQGLERALEELLNSEALLVLAGVKPAGDIMGFPKDFLWMELIAQAHEQGRLHHPDVRLHFSPYRYLNKAIYRDIRFVNLKTLKERLRSEPIRQAMSACLNPEGADLSLDELAERTAAEYFRLEYVGCSHLISGAVFGFPWTDVRRFQEERAAEKSDHDVRRFEERQGVDILAYDDSWQVWGFVTFPSVTSGAEIRLLRERTRHAESKRNRLQNAGLSNLEIWNGWSRHAEVPCAEFLEPRSVQPPNGR